MNAERNWLTSLSDYIAAAPKCDYCGHIISAADIVAYHRGGLVSVPLPRLHGICAANMPRVAKERE